MDSLLTWIRHAAPDGRADHALIAAFLADHDERAFAEVVRRHGPVVWGACRRLLPDPTDAEDAFQAAFLVLVRRGYRPPAPLGPWLYRVAVLTARGVRRRNARRLARSRPLPDDVPARPVPEVVELDGLLVRMPEKYRAAVVLCHLEGLTEPEAAARVGCPVGTLSARVSRGLAWLRARAGADPRVALAVAATGAVPAATTAAAVRTAVVARAAAVATGAVPSTVIQLAQEVTRSMLLTKLVPGALVASAAVLVAAAGVAALAQPGGQPEPAPVRRAVAPQVPDRAPPPPPVADPPGAVGPPRPGEPAWKADFRKAYALAAGRAVRLVPAPFPDSRTAFLKEMDPNRRVRPQNQHLLFRDDGRRIDWRGSTTRSVWYAGDEIVREEGLTLSRLLEWVVSASPPEVEGDADLLAQRADVDVVLRAGSMPAEQLAGLERELREKFQFPIRMAYREVEREVIVARGKVAPRPREGRKEYEVDYYAEYLGPDGPGVPNRFDLDGAMTRLGRFVNRRVVNEAAPLPAKTWLTVREHNRIAPGRPGFPHPDDVDPAKVLPNVAAQTGLTFTTERRTVRVLTVEAGR